MRCSGECPQEGIIGAAKGIGKEVALRFAQYGCVEHLADAKYLTMFPTSAMVVVADLDVVNGENLVAEIKSNQW
jgi:NAD(P)-dependent dehydrogenase (short-subunit alcohol dehydrogenase family)